MGGEAFQWPSERARGVDGARIVDRRGQNHTVTKAGNSVTKTVRVDDAIIQDLLNKMDEEASKSPNPRFRKKKSELFRYRRNTTIHLQNTSSGGSWEAYLVPTRNISEREVNFLHGTFLYPGTRCMVQLTTPHGTWDDVYGRVSDCRYIGQGSIHEVCVEFEESIDPAIYAQEAVLSRVLLVDDDPTLVRLTKLHLQALNADVDVAENGEEAIKMAMAKIYDVVLMDMHMPVKDGFEAVKELREQGYNGAIVAATALTQEEDRRQCLDVGCDRYIAKPYKKEDLGKLLTAMQEEPLYSSYRSDPTMTEVINAFVAELPVTLRKIEKMVASNDLASLQDVVRNLKAQGGGYGFEPITEVSSELEKKLKENREIGELQPLVANLSRLCMQARGSKVSQK